MNMKRKIVFILLLVSIMFIGIGRVSAEAYSIEAKNEVTDTGKSLKLILNGISNTEGTEYYVYLCNDSDPSPTFSATTTSLYPVETTSNGVIEGWHGVRKDDGYIYMKNNDWNVLKGYTKAYVLTSKKESNSKYINTLSQVITIAKPVLFNKGEGYDFAIYTKSSAQQYSSVFASYPANYDDNGVLIGKLKVKIGKINDSTIINKYVNNTSDAYNNLLSYAKNDANGITMIATNEGLGFSFISKLDIISGQNYYVLMTADDSSLRDITDVYIRTGAGSTLVEFKHDGTSNISSNTNIENPKTNDIKLLYIVFGVLIFGLLIFIGTKKLKRNK